VSAFGVAEAAHGLCAARALAYPGLSRPPHEPDETLPQHAINFDSEVQPQEALWSLLDIDTGYGAQVFVCKHCRCIYMPNGAV
jgi:hypothetical protein